MNEVASGTPLDERRRRARWRAWHRGTREVDLIMGRFADREMAGLSEPELTQFEALLEETEADVYAWLAETVAVPPAFDHPLFHRLKISAVPE